MHARTLNKAAHQRGGRTAMLRGVVDVAGESSTTMIVAQKIWAALLAESSAA